MIKEDVVGNLVHPDPFDRIAFGVGCGQLGDLRTVLLDGLVTGHASGGGGYGGEIAIVGNGMALLALQLQRAGVRFVTVGDRLLG